MTCKTPHAVAWSADAVALVDASGGLDILDLASGRVLARTPADPCVTLQPTKEISPRALVAFGRPTDRLFLVHEEGLQNVVPGERHRKQFFSFPKLAAFVARDSHGRAFFASAKAETRTTGPYVVETYLPDGQKSTAAKLTIDGELLAFAMVDDQPTWIVRRDANTTVENARGIRADLSPLGAFRRAWLEPNGAVVFVTERVAGKPRGRRLFAGLTKPDGTIAREQPIGAPADLKKHGGGIDARAVGDGVRVALYGSRKEPSLLLDVGKAVTTRELEPATFFALSPDGTLAVVVVDGATTLRDVTSWAVRHALHAPAPPPAPTPAREPEPTNDPLVLLERRLLATALNRLDIEQFITSLAGLDDAAIARETELVDLALAHDRTREEAFSLLRRHLLSPSPFSHDVRMSLLGRVARGIEKRPKVIELIGELRSPDAAIADAAHARLVEKPAVDLANAHSVFAGMVRAVLPDLTPASCHGGEPTPQIGSRGWPLLAMFLARRLEPTLRPDERKAFDFALEQAQRFASDNTTTHDRNRTPPAAKKTASLALSLAEAAWKEGRQVANRPDLVGGSLRPAAAKALKAVLETQGKAAALELLTATDDELRRLDVVQAVRERMDRDLHAEITASVYRVGEKNKVKLWLARLMGGYGLLWKERTRWQWTEGDRETVLATVPEPYFEGAAMAARG